MGISGKRVDPTTLIASAVKLLTDVKSPDDLIGVLQSLMGDSSLAGGDNLNHFVTTFNAFGKTALKILSDGSVESTGDSETSKGLDAFKSVMKNFEATEGTVFDSVKDLPEMLDRLSPEVSSTITTVLGKIQAISPAVAAANFVKG